MNARQAIQVAHGDLPEPLAEAFSRQPVIAWDSETSGLDWRSERLGTCQLFAESVGVVVISLGDGVPERLTSLLQDPSVEKIFHHAPFDLRFMVHAWGVRPASIRCTKIASKLLDPTAPNDRHSLQQLVQRHLGLHLAKGPVRTSDWSTAELSAEQVAYAAGDVIHLPALLEVLMGGLGTAGLKPLYDDCCAFLPAQASLEIGGFPDVFAY